MTTEYQRRSATIEAYRRGRFRYDLREDVPSRYESFVLSRDLLEGQLARHMPTSSTLFGAALETPVFPLIDTLARQKAVAFRERPTVSHEIDGEDTGIVGKLGHIVTDILELFAYADNLMVAHRAALLWVQPNGSLHVLPPYCLTVTTGNQWLIPINGDAPFVSGEEYLLYDPVHQTSQVIDSRGEPAAPGHPQEGNHVVMLWCENVPTSGWLPALPKSLLLSQETVMRLLVEVQLAFRAGAHGQRYLAATTGADAFPIAREIGATDEATVNVGQATVALGGGVEAVPTLPHGWDLRSLPSSVDPISYMRYVEAHIKLAYAAEEMVVSRMDLFSPQPANYSGAAKLIDASPLEESRQRRELRLSSIAERAFAAWAGIWNTVAPEAWRIPDGGTWRVRFPGLLRPGIVYDQSAMQGLTAAAGLGLVDLPSMYARINEVPLETARQRLFRAAGTAGRVKIFASENSDAVS